MRYLFLQLAVYLYRQSKHKLLIEEDLEHWKEILNLSGTYPEIIKKLFVEKQEFRNLFYYRIGGIRVISRIMRVIFPPLPTLYIWTENIGGGLFIQHGFATVIAASKIGKHCFINQQVTIGYIGNNAPIIEDNVTITCGAKVLGNIKIGNNVVIGANSVVVKNVPSNATVVGVPGKVIKLNGEKFIES